MNLDEFSDIVVDANIFHHALNDGKDCHKSALDFLEQLKNSDVEICFDKNGVPDDGSIGGAIAQEYDDILRSGDTNIAKTTLELKLHQNRFRVLDTTVPTDIRNFINKSSIDDSIDQKIVGVAYNSDNQICVSDDFDDFKGETRENLEKEFCVLIRCAGHFPTPYKDDCINCER